MALSISLASAGASSRAAASLTGTSPARAAPQGVNATIPARNIPAHDKPGPLVGTIISRSPVGRASIPSLYCSTGGRNLTGLFPGRRGFGGGGGLLDLVPGLRPGTRGLAGSA